MAKFAIKADVNSDDHKYKVHFDAEVWFRQASDAELTALAAIGWGGDYASDAVAEFTSTKEPMINLVLDYCSNTEDIGYECHVNKDDAIQWLKENRPEFHIPD